MMSTEYPIYLIHQSGHMGAAFGYHDRGRVPPRSSPRSKVMQEVAPEGGCKIDVLTYADVLVDRDYIKATTQPDNVNRFGWRGQTDDRRLAARLHRLPRDRPYYDPVGTYAPGYRGCTSVTEQQVVDAVDWAFQNDVQIITHANGEAAPDRTS